METAPNVTDHVRYRGERYRVTGYKRRVEDNFPDNPIDLLPQTLTPEEVAEIRQIRVEFVAMDLLREKLRRAEQGLPCTRRWRWQNCTREDATHVQLYGLSYPIAAIRDLMFESPSTWPAELIEQETRAANSPGRLLHYPFSEWYWE